MQEKHYISPRDVAKLITRFYKIGISKSIIQDLVSKYWYRYWKYAEWYPALCFKIISFDVYEVSISIKIWSDFIYLSVSFSQNDSTSSALNQHKDRYKRPLYLTCQENDPLMTLYHLSDLQPVERHAACAYLSQVLWKKSRWVYSSSSLDSVHSFNIRLRWSSGQLEEQVWTGFSVFWRQLSNSVNITRPTTL